MERFSRRVAVVTGVSSGIGAAIAEDLVKSGMQVVGIARRIQRIEDLAKKLSNLPGKLHPMQVDLSDADQVIKAYREIESKFGAIAVLVNNAAIGEIRKLQDIPIDKMQQTVNTNFTNLAIGCKEAINNMKKHKVIDGHIVNINSVGGHRVPYVKGVNFGLYAGTKHALTALCEGLRQELSELEGYQIRVTSISPGAVNTEMIPPEFVHMLGGPDSAKILKPQDISRTVLFAIASPPAVEIVELTIEPTGETEASMTQMMTQ